MKNVWILALMGLSGVCWAGMSPQQYADSRGLVGKPGFLAYKTFTEAGFQCRLASGVPADVPMDEIVLYCVKDDTSDPPCDRELGMVVRFDWGGVKPDPSKVTSKNTKEVIGQCIP